VSSEQALAERFEEMPLDKLSRQWLAINGDPLTDRPASIGEFEREIIEQILEMGA
jgi:hypothetical protein